MQSVDAHPPRPRHLLFLFLFLFPPVVTLRLAAGTLAGSAPTAQEQPPAIDVSGIAVFWRLHDLLVADREPSESEWDALWATPGYQTLEARERRRAALTTAMRLAFKPSSKRAADSALQGSSWVARVIPHLRTVSTRRDTLEAAAGRLASPAAFDSARRLAARYLPPGTVGSAPPPAVSLIYFLDARGYDRILLDPSYLLDLHDPLPVLAHELHHYYRNRNDRSSTRPFGDDMIAWRLATTETEGIAGLVDKSEIPGLRRDELPGRYRDAAHLRYFEDYQEDYRRSDQWLAWTDDILRRADAHPDSSSHLGRLLDRRLPDNGRIMGAYMAAVISRQLGHDALIATVGNPWAFWRSYNVAARRTNGETYVLSDAAIRTIATVEKRYQ